MVRADRRYALSAQEFQALARTEAWAAEYIEQRRARGVPAAGTWRADLVGHDD
jgi:hypothetical protein